MTAHFKFERSARAGARLLVGALLLGWAASAAASEPRLNPAETRAAVEKAVAYLSREVASWKDEQRCYSCHHHGDGARALLAAKARGFAPSPAALQVSLDWLVRPADWDANGPDGEFSDRQLARIQFAAALSQAQASQLLENQAPLEQAANRLVAEQLPSGAWDFVGADEIGAPATYGRTLATVLARRTLVLTAAPRLQPAVDRADRWLRATQPRGVLDAAAVLIGLAGATDEQAIALRRHCRDILARGQGPDGGWGPYVNAPPEPFDTAVAVLGLAAEPDDAARQARRRGIQFLLKQQTSEGNWPETTRPTPRESYAERMSTTAWATLALLHGLD